MPRVIGMGIIGAGRIFEHHARAYAALGGRARLLAVAEIDEERLRRATAHHFIPFAYRDHRALLERADVEVVAICTPPVLHEALVIDALEAGKYVLCEKPLAPTLAATDRILTAARRFPGRLSTVHQFRWLPEVQRTIWLRDHDRLGRLLFGRFSRFARHGKPGKLAKPGKPAKPGKARTDWWGRWEVAGGGAVMTQLIHELDLMGHLFGAATEVSALMDTLKEPIESEDTCAAVVRFASGALGCCYGTVVAQKTASAFDVFGERGSTHLPWALEALDSKWRAESLRAVMAAYPAPAQGSTILGWLAKMLPGRAQSPEPEEGETPAHAPYVAAVLDAIEAGQPLPVGPEEARAAVELCTALYASALEGRPMALPLGRDHRFYAGITSGDYAERDRQLPSSVGRGVS